MIRNHKDERRRYPRRRVAMPIVNHSGPGVLNHVDNISATGVLCHTVRPVPLMTKLSMALELPKPAQRRIECEGIVVRCEPDEVGDDHFKVAILFTRIDEDDAEAIQQYVENDVSDRALRD